MKKFTRICLITALVLILIGGTVCVIGAVAGGFGEIEGMKQDSKAWSIVRRATDHGAWKFFDEENDDESDQREEDRGRETEADTETLGEGEIFELKNRKIPTEYTKLKITAEEVADLNIDIGGAAVFLTKSSDDRFGIRIDGKERYSYYEEDGVFYLENEEKDVVWRGNNESIYLYIPKDLYFESVSISMGGGIIIIDELLADQMDLEVGAGVITSEKLECRELSVETGAGKTSLRGVKADEMGLSVGMGHLSVWGEVKNEIIAECGMGAIKLELDNKEEDFNYEISCAAGKVSVGKHNYAGIVDEDIDNDADGECSLDCAMGSISVDFEK